MSGRIVSLSPWPAALAALEGLSRDFVTLDDETPVELLDARINAANTGDLLLEIGDGTNTASLTIPSGANHASAAQSAVLGPGAVWARVTGATDGTGLSGNLWLRETVPSGTTGPGLIDLADLKVLLGLSGTTAPEDAYLQRQIDAYSDRVRSYCGRHFNVRRYTEHHDCPDMVYLREAPIQILHTITAGGTTVDPATVRVDRASGQISPARMDAGPQWWRYGDLVVDYEAGFDPMPPALHELLAMGIGRRWAAYQSGDPAAVLATVARETITDAGTVQYAIGSSLRKATEVGDLLLGIPISSFDPWVRPLHMAGPAEILSFWELS